MQSDQGDLRNNQMKRNQAIDMYLAANTRTSQRKEGSASGTKPKNESSLSSTRKGHKDHDHGQNQRLKLKLKKSTSNQLIDKYQPTGSRLANSSASNHSKASNLSKNSANPHFDSQQAPSMA